MHRKFRAPRRTLETKRTLILSLNCLYMILLSALSPAYLAIFSLFQSLFPPFSVVSVSFSLCYDTSQTVFLLISPIDSPKHLSPKTKQKKNFRFLFHFLANFLSNKQTRKILCWLWSEGEIHMFWTCLSTFWWGREGHCWGKIQNKWEWEPEQMKLKWWKNREEQITINIQRKTRGTTSTPVWGKKKNRIETLQDFEYNGEKKKRTNKKRDYSRTSSEWFHRNLFITSGYLDIMNSIEKWEEWNGMARWYVVVWIGGTRWLW